MAQDQEVALKVNPVPAVAYDPASSLENAQTILGNQTKLQAGQTQLQMLNRENAGQDIQYRNQLIANAAAHALDSDSWDANMQEAIDKGAPEAAQFLRRYSPLMQQRVFGAYGGSGQSAATAGSALAGGAATPSNFDQTFQNATPQQMGEILRQGNIFMSALSTVKDQASQNRAAAALRAAGVPDLALRGPYNPLQIVRLWNEVNARNNYLQDKVGLAASGVPTQNLVPIPWKVTNVKDSLGQEHPIAYNPNNPAQAMSIKPNAGSASPYNSFAATMDQAESRNPTEKNPLSSATGAGQFIDQTWLDTIKSARPDLVQGLSDKQILTLRNDPVLSREMTADYARQNASKLSQAGLPVTSTTLAMAHRLGPDGAAAVLKANSNTPLSQILSKKAMDANPQLAGMTAGQYAVSTVRQFGNGTLPAPGATPKLTDFDMENVDPNQRGWDYAKQFPIEVQDAARAYMNGGVMPAGNPRNQGIVTMAKMVAQKVAADQGRPELADDSLYPQRRQMQVELAKTTSPQALGGQITFGGTALGHLATYATDLADLHNVSGGITTLGHGVNWLRALGPEQAGKVNKASGDAQHYGQEITKFYGGGPGGEAERDRFLSNANPATKTPQELAGVIRGERDLIPERYAQIRANIENVLGPEAAAKALARLDTQASMDKINAALAKLDPTGPEAAKLKNAAPPTETPASREAFVVGRTYRDSVSGEMARYDGPDKWTPVTSAPAKPASPEVTP